MRVTGTAVMCAALFVVLAGCAKAGSNPAEGASGVVSGSTRGGWSGSPGSGGSAPAVPARPAPSAATGAPTGATGSCGSARVTVSPGAGAAPVCLRVGEQLVLDAPSSPTQPWQLFTSSDTQTVTCDSSQQPNGSATATCRAIHPGAATISTGTAPFAGDPHGPPQQQWQLTVTVPK